ncbi:MAG TPA: HAMP domain-containing sensor histidine kinase [Streptosporangiaceae bacterium]|nr:HAMP domain-containing sensor histidine kinase [Streptosporangiaceae bacterium]
MTTATGDAWRSVRRLPDRTPLRVKLITAVLALVIIALAVISFTGAWLLRGYILSPTDASLENQGNQNQIQHYVESYTAAGGQHYLTGTSVIWVAGGQTQQVIVPTTAASGLQGGSGNMTSLGQLQTEPSPDVSGVLSWLQSHPDQPITVPAQSGPARWRVLAFPGTSADGTPGLIVASIDVSDQYRTIADLVRIDLVVSTVVVIVLAVVGIAVVRSNLRPLDEIEETAEEIAQGHLNRRVPDRDPRTEVGRLGRSINTMLAQIESAFHARERSEEAAVQSEERMRRFIADAGHELRTPLTAIRGFAEYYRQRGGAAGPGGEPAAGLTPQDLDRIMNRVEGEASRMGVLVEDLLLLARVDQQRPIERKPVDLLVLAADAVQDTRMIAPDRPVSLTVEPGSAFLVLGDEVRLRQVIGNLMSNALHHTPEKTPVDVRLGSGVIGAAPESPGGPARAVPAAVLEVADKGQGLTPEQAQRVFERFYRADQARNRKSGGSGLGLAIVSALVAAHGGTATVDSTPGQGATFRITLPLAPDAGDDPDPDAEPDPRPQAAAPGTAPSRR